MQLNDAKFSFLRGAGGGNQTGALPEMWIAWLNLDAGVTSQNRNTAERQFLIAKGQGNKPLNDGWYDWLGSQAYTGTLNERWLKFFTA